MIIKIPFRIFSFDAITLYPFVFIYKENADNVRLLNHEKIHLAQYRELCVVGFLFLYLWYYFKGLVKSGHNIAYRMNPFEIEAYENEFYEDYLEKRTKFAWKEYRRVN